MDKKYLENAQKKVKKVYSLLKGKFLHYRELLKDFKLEESRLNQFKAERNDEREFLPAALEIQETPAAPLGRFMLWFLCGFFTLAVLWAAFGKVDIVAVGEGKITPSGNIKVVQPFETGVIKEILVKDGQRVAVGDVLVKMDITETAAEKARLEHDLVLARADVVRLSALVNNVPAVFPDTFSEELVLIQFERYETQKAEEKAKVASLKKSVEQKQAEVRSVASDVKRLEATLPLIREREKIITDLVKKGIEAKINALSIQEERIGQENELQVLKERFQEVTAALSSAEEQLLASESEFRRVMLTELTETKQRVVALEKELSKASNKFELQTLRSPIDGTVQELMIHTVGGVVTPAQELMKLVPELATLEANIFLQNKDIGFVEEGQHVAIKLEAFPFTKYGMIDGTVTHVSHDAIQDEQKGLVFKAKVSMDQDHVMVRDKQVNLTSGMSLSGEIKTGERRIIEYFLSPVLKYQAEVIRER